MSNITTTIDPLIKSLQMTSNYQTINHPLNITGQLTLPDGLANTPSLVFANSNNTGLYSCMDGCINMTFNGTSNIMFESNTINIQQSGGSIVLNNGSSLTITAATIANNVTVTIPDPGVSTSFLLGAANQSNLTGIKTFTNSSAGNGIAYNGTLTASGDIMQTIELDGRVGVVQFLGINSTASGQDILNALVLTNSYVTSNTIGNVTIIGQQVNENACFCIKNVTFGAGTMTIMLTNCGSAMTGGGNWVKISFVLFN